MIAEHIARFTSNIWQVHAFCEGNTRTTAVFIIKYLRTLGFDVSNDIFAKNAWYFRNALVRANYTDLSRGIHETYEYLNLIFANLLLGSNHILRNRDLVICGWEEGKENDNQNQKNALINVPLNDQENVPINVPLKITKTEKNVLYMIMNKSNITAQDMAIQLGVNEKTTKRALNKLKSMDIIKRVGSKKTGHWIIKDEINEF